MTRARSGKTVLLVTHERDVAQSFSRTIELADGELVLRNTRAGQFEESRR